MKFPPEDHIICRATPAEIHAQGVEFYVGRFFEVSERPYRYEFVTSDLMQQAYRLDLNFAHDLCSAMNKYSDRPDGYGRWSILRLTDGASPQEVRFPSPYQPREKGADERRARDLLSEGESLQ